MKRSAALQHIAHIASLGLGDRIAVPLMIDTLAGIVPSAFINFLWLDEKEQPSDISLPAFMPEPLEVYFEGNGQLDPAREPTVASTLAEGQSVGAGERWNRRRGFHDTILYNETLRPYGIGAGLDLVLRRGGTARGILFVNREPRLSRFGSDERQLLVEVQPHFLRAMDAPARSLETQDTASADLGIVVIRRDGVIVFASENAPRLIYQQSDRGVGRMDRDPYWIQTVDILFSRASGGGVARLERRTSWGTLVFNLYPQGADAREAGDNSLYAISIERLVPPEVDILERLRVVDLSPRERQVAFELTTMPSGEEARARLGMTRATWRDYQKRVYDKLEVHSRSELTRKLSHPARMH